jgi:hypothetical protein
LACAGQERVSQVNASPPPAPQEAPRASAASPDQSGEPPAKLSELPPADGSSESIEQPCGDAHQAPGGCKGGYIVPERNLCFLLVESACRCKCNGRFESCRAPKVEPKALPGPVAPDVVCTR